MKDIDTHRELLKILGRDTHDSGIRSLSSERWDAVIQQAMHHGVVPLLMHRLKGADLLTVVPPHIRDGLRQSYMTALDRNVRLYHNLAVLLVRLNTEMVPVIVLKGAHLAEKVYGNIALRSFDDIDLMFQEKDLSKCEKIVFEDANTGSSPKTIFDLHWNIDYSTAYLPIAAEDLWARSETTTIGGVRTRVLCPEDLLLHQCTHIAFHHRFQDMGLRALCDIRQIVRRCGDKLDWKTVEDRSKAWRVANSVFLTLALAKELLGANVPADFLERAAPPGLRRGRMEWAIRGIFAPKRPSLCLSPHFWAFVRAKTWREKLVHLHKLALPSRSQMIKKTEIDRASGPFPLPYAARAIKYFNKYAKAVLGLMLYAENMTKEAGREIENIKMIEWMSEERTRR